MAGLIGEELPYTLVLDLQPVFTGHGTHSRCQHLYGCCTWEFLASSQMSDDDIELGEEICNTGGVSEAFTFTRRLALYAWREGQFVG